MSSGGGTIAAAKAVPLSLPSLKSPPPPRRKPVTENWDDDFEFSLPVKAKQASASSPVTVTTPKREPASYLGEGHANGNGLSKHESPDSFDEDWDDPLESVSGPSRSESTRSATRPSRSPLAPAPIHLHPPRSSHSQSPTLPSPVSATSITSWRTVGFPSQASPSSWCLSTARPGESTSRTISKRSSTSFVPARQGDVTPLAAHKHLPMTRSSPNLSDKLSRPSSGSSSPLRRVPVSSTSNGDLTPVPSPRRHSPTKSVPSGAFPLPMSARSSPAKGFPSPLKSTPGSSHTASSSARSPEPSPSIKASPSCDSIRERKPSFWKRLSSGPSGSKDKDSPDKSSPFRRRRSSSVGNLVPANDEPVPPLPPLPANLRSPTGFSSPQRLPSGSSQQSSSGKSKTKMRIAAPFLMRRSSSNLSAAIDSPSKPGKGSAKMMLDGTSSISSSPVASPHRASPRHTPPTGSTPQFPSPASTASHSGERTLRKSSGAHSSRTFSPGFHLPSPSPGSPYSRVSSPSSMHPSESDLDPEDQRRSRQRVRHTSAMPIPRRKESSITLSPQGSASVLSFTSTTGTSGPGTSVTGTSVTGTSAPRTVHMPTLEALSKGSASSRQGSSAAYRQASATSYTQAAPSPVSTSRSVSSSHSMLSSSVNSNASLAAQTQSTLRHLTSFSRKHGRRLSGGWKFSSGPTTQEQRGGNLATVEGSPSKPSPIDPTEALLNLPTSTFPDDADFDLDNPQPNRHAKEHSSVSAAPRVSDAPSSFLDWNETTKSHSARERRRLSLGDFGGDFVIPDGVLAKQKELKRGIVSVKKFAGGVQSLKQLVAAHDTVCDNVLATGTQDDMNLFVTLENEYTQWWEMATVLIEVGSTGTEDTTAVPVRTRRITLATEDARRAGEALNSISARGASYSTVKSIFTDSSGDVFGGSDLGHQDPESRSATGKSDLSGRQLEMLRTMLRTPVSASDSVVPTVDQRQALKARMRQSMPAAPTKPREVLPNAPATVRITNGPVKQAPGQVPATVSARPSPDKAYIIPSPSYPPDTATQLPPRNKGGLAGLRDFLRSLKGGSNNSNSNNNSANDTTPKARRPVSQPGRRRPAPINVQAAEKYGHSPTTSPVPSAGSHEPMVFGNSVQSSDLGSYARVKPDYKKRRPSLKSIFRPSSGNWHDLVRATPPPSPLPTIPAQGTPDEPKTSTDSTSSRPGLVRAPSIPGFARLKLSKPYGTIGADTLSPTKAPRHRASVGVLDAPAVAANHPPVPPIPGGATTPPDGEATLRLKSRILGLGHPSEASPSRASSSPAPRTNGELQPPEDAPRCRSDGGVRNDDEPIIALTPENLPVLLDYVKQCEKKLQEWRVRAVSLENPGTSPTSLSVA